MATTGIVMGTLLIDDEADGRNNLRALLNNYCPQTEVIGEAASAKEGLEQIRSLGPDLIFLDIEMPGGSGFEMLEQLGPADLHVVFVTAYSEYAVRAFRFSAADYLLKPINIVHLQAAVEKCAQQHLIKEFNRKATSHLAYRIGRNPFEKIGLPTMEGTQFVDLPKILYLQADGNYTRFTLAEQGSLLVSRPMKEYEDLFEPEGFFRVHASWIINLSHMNRYVKGKGGLVIMDDGKEIPVSQRRKKGFQQVIRGFNKD